VASESPLRPAVRLLTVSPCRSGNGSSGGSGSGDGSDGNGSGRGQSFLESAVAPIAAAADSVATEVCWPDLPPSIMQHATILSNMS